MAVGSVIAASACTVAVVAMDSVAAVEIFVAFMSAFDLSWSLTDPSFIVLVQTTNEH